MKISIVILLSLALSIRGFSQTLQNDSTSKSKDFIVGYITNRIAKEVNANSAQLTQINNLVSNRYDDIQSIITQYPDDPATVKSMIIKLDNKYMVSLGDILNENQYLKYLDKKAKLKKEKNDFYSKHAALVQSTEDIELTF